MYLGRCKIVNITASNRFATGQNGTEIERYGVNPSSLEEPTSARDMNNRVRMSTILFRGCHDLRPCELD